MTSFNWSPGIGDPTFLGWLTVILYFAAALNCWRLSNAFEVTADRAAKERRAWRYIAILFFALGVNKQLDIQTALTEAGRLIAHFQGWYAQRQLVQVSLIGSVAIACVMLILVLLVLMRRGPLPTRTALLGTIFVLGYVLIRAASFHHIDRFIGDRILGLRWNWVIEISGITVVLLSSQWRLSLPLPKPS